MNDNNQDYHQQLWDKSLSMIRRCIDDPHIYDVWFRDIRFFSFDQSSNTLTLAVPSHYVIEYIEEVRLDLLSNAIDTFFNPDVELKYHISEPNPAVSVAGSVTRKTAPAAAPGHVSIAIPDASVRLREQLQVAVGDRPLTWLPSYDRIASWLADNRGRGLLIIGTPGLGKTLICRTVLPAILEDFFPVTVIGADEIRNRLAELKSAPVVIIDNLGREPRKHFGDTDNSFLDLLTSAERTGNILVIATCLSTTPVPANHPNASLYPDSIQHRYGADVIDRLRTLTSTVLIQGKSMRGIG